MARFDRKKFREEQFRKAKEVEQEAIVVPEQSEELGKVEQAVIQASRFVAKHRFHFLIGIGVVVLFISGFIAYHEYKHYQTMQATIEIERLEKKLAVNFNIEPKKKIQDYEAILSKYSSKDTRLRIYKKLADINQAANEPVKAAEYLEKAADEIEEVKELRAYYYYIAGSYREQANDPKAALINYTKAGALVANNRETPSLTAWSFYQSGRLQLLNGDKEAAKKDLTKVLDISSEMEDLTDVKKLATYLLIKTNKG